MKTSNKILTTAFAAYLLFTVANTAAFIRDYSAVKNDADSLIAQLARTRIHVLVVEHGRFDVRRHGPYSQSLWFPDGFDPEGIRIRSDTLLISGAPTGYAVLPDLESFLLNGKPQPIRNI